MLSLSTHSRATFLPFALLGHESAVADDATLLGEPSQEWTWEPKGELKAHELAIYASGGMSTTQKTGMNQYDHGEYY